MNSPETEEARPDAPLQGCTSWPVGSRTARGGKGRDGEEPSKSTGAPPAAKALPPKHLVALAVVAILGLFLVADYLWASSRSAAPSIWPSRVDISTRPTASPPPSANKVTPLNLIFMIIGLLSALYCLQLFCALALSGCAITEIWWEIFFYYSTCLLHSLIGRVEIHLLLGQYCLQVLDS